MTLFSSCPVGCKLKSVNMSHFDSFSSSFEQSRHKMSDRVLKNQNKHSNRVNKFDIQSCFRVCRIKTLPRWLDINHCRIKGVLRHLFLLYSFITYHFIIFIIFYYIIFTIWHYILYYITCTGLGGCIRASLKLQLDIGVVWQPMSRRKLVARG